MDEFNSVFTANYDYFLKCAVKKSKNKEDGYDNLMNVYEKVSRYIELGGIVMDIKAYILQCIFNTKEKHLMDSIEGYDKPTFDEVEMTISVKEYMFMLYMLKYVFGVKEYVIFRDYTLNSYTLKEIAAYYQLTISDVHRTVKRCREIICSEMMSELLKKL
jgi:hypothetical protein